VKLTALIASLALALSFGAGHLAGSNSAKAKSQKALLEKLEKEQREVARLVGVNEELQRDYNAATATISNLAVERARTDRVRQQERNDIVASAGRIAEACGRYASAAERDIGIIEEQATGLGHDAARASATAHALRKTIDEQRASLPR